MALPEISVEELKRMREQGEPHMLIDVREPQEYTAANIGGTLIPLSELEARRDEIPREGRVIVHCKMGGRSARAVEYLRALGYTNVENLGGGINAWSARIDPSVPTY